MLAALWLSRNFWFPGRYVVGFDTVTYSGPNLQVTLEAWRERRLPLWNDLVFGGTVHLGNMQAGALYPPKVVGLVFDTNRAMGVLVAGHVVLMAVGMVLLMRRLGARAPAGFAAAVVVVGSGAVLTRSVQFEQILVLAWAPLLLWCVTGVLVAAARPWGAMAATGAVVAMVLLAGHPQIAHQLVLMAATWTLAVALGRRVRATWWRLGDLAIAVFAGAAVAAPQLVAGLAATRDSDLRIGRTLTELESPALSSRPDHLVRILFGTVRRIDQDLFAGGFESIGYVGVAAAVLAVVGFVVAIRDGSRRPLGIAVTALAVLGAVWSLGPRTPLFTAAYDWVPGFDLARASARWVDVVAIATGVGVGWAVDAIARRDDLRLPVAVAASAFGLVMLLGVTDVVDLSDRGTVAAWVVIALLAAACVVVAVRWPAAAAAGAVALVTIELLGTTSVSPAERLTTSTPFDQLPNGPAAALDDEDGNTLALTDDALGDPAYLVAGFRPNTNVLAGVRSLDGYDGGVQMTKRFVALGTSLGPGVDPALPLRNKLPTPFTTWMGADLGVRWVLLDDRRDASTQLPGWEPTDLADGQFTVYENPAWIADAVLQPAGTTDRRAVDLERPRPGRFVARLDGTGGRLLVYAQRAPGWRAEVDGRPTPLAATGGFFLAVDVPAGSREVTFTYEPRWVVPSFAATALGGAAIVAMGVVAARRVGALKRGR